MTHTDPHARQQDSFVTDSDEIVEVPVKPPREPSAYRTTKHFKQRLRERVPGFQHGPVPAKIIENGSITRRPWTAPEDLEEPGQPIAFTGEVDGDTYTVIVALMPSGYRSADTKHAVLTVWQGEAPAADQVADRGDQR